MIGSVYNLRRWDRWSDFEGPPSEATINRALHGLREHGFVDRPDGNLYAINETGRRYLAGELDAADLDPTDEN